MAGNISLHKSKDLVWKDKRGRIITKVSVVVMLVVFSHVQLFVIPWSVANNTPLSMEFSRQEYWNGLPFPTSEGMSTFHTLESHTFALCSQGARDSFHLRKDACSLQHTFSSQKKTCPPVLQGGM